METKKFSQRVLNVVKYFWKQRSGYGAILLVLFALGLICLLVVDITSRGEQHGKVFFICLKAVCLGGITGGLLTLNAWIAEMKDEWHNGFWKRLRTILTSVSGLGLFAFCISALFLPADSSIIENVFQTVGAIGLFGFLFGTVASGMTFFLEQLLKGIGFMIERLLR